MKESNVEGVASHNGPEPCGGGGDIAAEALAGEKCRRGIEPRNRSNLSSADPLVIAGRQHIASRYGKLRDGSAGSKTHGMHRSFLHENRETLRSATADCAGVRTVNSKETRL